MNIKTKIAITATIIFWSSAFVGIRACVGDYSPEGLALLRFIVASIVMGGFYFMSSRQSPIAFVDKIQLMLVGVVGIGIYNLTLNYGELAVSSGVASFIIAQSPVFSILLAVIFLGESLTVNRILGFLVSLIGVTVIAYGEIGKFELTTGLLYILAAMISGSFYSFLQKPFAKKYSAIDITTYILWGGTLFLLWHYDKMLHDISHASIRHTLIIVYLGIFPAALAYLAWSYTLRHLTLSHAVSFLYLLPFVTAMMGWLVLGEIPAFISVMGALIALVGVWLVNQSYGKTRGKTASSQLVEERS